MNTGKLRIYNLNLSDIHPYSKNPRKNDSAVKSVAASIKQFGFLVPLVISSDHEIVAGHTRYKAAKQLGLGTVPCIIADELTADQIKAFRLADNKIGELAEWDFDLLKEELDGLDFGDLDLDWGIDDESESEETQHDEVNMDETISVVVSCENELKAEELFYRLSEEGYKCRISTL